MTTDEIVAYYASLLLLQYITKPKASDTIKDTIRMFIMDQLPSQVQDAYDLETAVGVQLDVLGKYAGANRNGYDFSGPVTLDDDDFRLLIKMNIFQNSSGSSLADIQNLIQMYFPGVLAVYDYQNMRLDYLFDSAIGSNVLAEFFVKQNALPRPMGVELGAFIYSPTIDNFFGYRTYDAPAFNASPFNSYDDYTMDTPWLSYSDAIYE